MPFWKIIWKTMCSHRYAYILAVISICAGIALMVAVVSLEIQSRQTFTRSGLGIDAVLAPKGSPLQIVLNALYHLEDMPGKIPWTYFQTLSAHPLVKQAVPFMVGHSYRGVRVNAVGLNFFTEFEYLPGKKFSFDPSLDGKGQHFSGPRQAVAGAVAAKELGIRLGQSFHPVCGINESDPVHQHDPIVFTGIMAPTGTPHDRAIYIPLLTFYGLEGHPRETLRMAADTERREISGAYIQLKRIRGGAIHPGIQHLRYEVNQTSGHQLVLPAEVMPRLYRIIGWVDRVLLAIAAMLTLLASSFLFCSLVQSLRETRQDLAMMRLLGATRFRLTCLVMTQACTISLCGGMAGLILGHFLIFMGAHYVKVEAGVGFTALYLSPADWMVLPGALVMGITAALIPAVQAYRMGVLDHLEKC